MRTLDWPKVGNGRVLREREGPGRSTWRWWSSLVFLRVIFLTCTLILKIFMIFLASSRKILGYYLSEVVVAAFQILSNSSLIMHQSAMGRCSVDTDLTPCSWALLKIRQLNISCGKYRQYLKPQVLFAVFTSALHLSPFWARLIHSISSHPFPLKFHLNIIVRVTSQSS
jgi:hypothetical protein